MWVKSPTKFANCWMRNTCTMQDLSRVNGDPPKGTKLRNPEADRCPVTLAAGQSCYRKQPGLARSSRPCIITGRGLTMRSMKGETSN